MSANQMTNYLIFFLCLFLRSLFFLLCVAILARLRFLPQGNTVTSLTCSDVLLNYFLFSNPAFHSGEGLKTGTFLRGTWMV